MTNEMQETQSNAGGGGFDVSKLEGAEKAAILLSLIHI